MPRFDTGDFNALCETMKNYLDAFSGDTICPLQIWYEALGGYGVPTPADLKAMEKALGGLERGRDALKKGLSEEFALFDLRGALDALGEVTGETGVENLLDEIFSRFCIGK